MGWSYRVWIAPMKPLVRSALPHNPAVGSSAGLQRSWRQEGECSRPSLGISGLRPVWVHETTSLKKKKKERGVEKKRKEWKRKENWVTYVCPVKVKGTTHPVLVVWCRKHENWASSGSPRWVSGGACWNLSVGWNPCAHGANVCWVDCLPSMMV